MLFMSISGGMKGPRSTESYGNVCSDDVRSDRLPRIRFDCARVGVVRRLIKRTSACSFQG